MGFLEGKKKLLFGVVGFLAPYLTAGLTGEVSWREAARLSGLAAIAYIVGEGVADAGRGVTASSRDAAEVLAAARRQSSRRPPAATRDV
jgi:hypothetical protein